MEIILCSVVLLAAYIAAIRYLRSTESLEMMTGVLADDSAQKGAWPPKPKRAGYPYQRVGAWLAGAVVFTAARLAALKSFGLAEFIFAFLGALAGDFVWKKRVKVAEGRLKRSMEYHLPLVMERMVMAVGAGLDIHPALLEVTRTATDPVSRKLAHVAHLCERGLGLRQALEQVSTAIVSSSVKHAFVHLGLAQSEGGELVRPLRELSDATQSYYQESIEEEIAKLPAKAVLPLVVTFTGLIICFLTVPLIQVGTLVKKVSTLEAQ